MNEWKKARKKPIIIEYREVIPNDIIALTKTPVEKIDTREGVLCGYPDKDFVIRGVQGELYPIKKDIFYQTYDVIE